MKIKLFHDKETPNIKSYFFQKNIFELKKISRTLIISGGSRNGNHLIWSLLDGNKNLPFLPGEDKFLSQIFWRNLENSKKFLQDLKNNKSSFLRKLSGLKSDKWLRIYKKKINKKVWAGNHKNTVMPLLEFPKSKNVVNYPNYKNFLEKNFKNFDNFTSIWNLYLKALIKLTDNKNKKLKYDYIYAESGLRRELLFLSENKFNFICIVPIRRFETFYFSKIKSYFNSTRITKKYIKEAWEQWYHKSYDYLQLKKKFPKNFLIVPYEDFADKNKRKKSIKKVCQKLNIKFEKINLLTTHYKKGILPNSSFRQKVEIFEKKLSQSLKLKFPKEKYPKNYTNFYNVIKKNFY